MPKHYRLTTRAQLHGEVRDPGYIFTLAEGELGPMRSVSAGSPEAQIADHIGGESGLKDVPMYVALSEEEEGAIEEREAEIIREADEHAAASAGTHASGEGESEKLRTDGPTVQEYVAAGYKAVYYPPSGYASKSSPEEIAAAIEAEKAEAAPQAGPQVQAAAQPELPNAFDQKQG